MGFLASLFDLSFRSLVATRLIRLIYVLTMAAIVVISLLIIAGGFEIGPLAGIVCLLLVAPLGAFVSLVYARVGLEFTIALLRIAENTTELVHQGEPESRTPDVRTA